MARSSKLKNTKAIREMLDGRHFTQTKTSVGFFDTETAGERAKVRKPGDVWEEVDALGKVTYWEQKNGYRVRSKVHPKLRKIMQDAQDYLNSFSNCPKDKCTCIAPNRLDIKFRRLKGMCFDCVLKEETKMRIEGKFYDYTKDTMKQNALAFFKQADTEVDILVEQLQGVSSYANGDGTIENWEPTNKTALIERVKDDYQKLKDKILTSFEQDDIQ